MTAPARRLLFVSVDGVLNCGAWLERAPVVTLSRLAIGLRPEERRLYGAINPLAVSYLNRLLMAVRTNLPFKGRYLAEVVISVPSQVELELSSVARVFEAHGLAAQVVGVIGQGAASGQLKRGQQIHEWMREHAPAVQEGDVLVIGPDDPADLKPRGDRLLQTTWRNGLQDEHIRLGARMMRHGEDAATAASAIAKADCSRGTRG